MATNPIANAHSQRLIALNRIKQGLVGQSTSITLLTKNKTTGALDELLTIEGSWSKEHIRKEFLGRADDATASYKEEFQISAGSLDQETAKRVAAVKHGDITYAVLTPIAPQELQQYWRIAIISVSMQ